MPAMFLRPLQSTAVLPAIRCGSLEMFPLHCEQPPLHAPYMTLEEALGAHVAELTEVTEGGSVPELLFVNRGDTAVLLLDGEELIGARQNRILNTTVLVGPGKTLVVPVSCVERGRWAYQSRKFSAGGRTQFARGKARKLRAVSRNLRASGMHRADQGEVWADISEKSARMRVDSPTEAMSAMYDRHERDVSTYREQIKPVAGQSGAAFAIDGQLIGIELFDSESAFRRLFDKVLSGYVLDAVERPESTHSGATVAEVRDFIARMLEAVADPYPALGLGVDVRVSTLDAEGAALIVDGTVVHLATYPAVE